MPNFNFLFTFSGEFTQVGHEMHMFDVHEPTPNIPDIIIGHLPTWQALHSNQLEEDISRVSLVFHLFRIQLLKLIDDNPGEADRICTAFDTSIFELLVETRQAAQRKAPTKP